MISPDMSAPLPLAERAFPAPADTARAAVPLVLLHGLLGSSRQWQAVASELAVHQPVFALDLRNHGRSPQSTVMDYPAMLADLLAWLDSRNLPQVDLLGHSMGGKLAMAFACRHSDRVRRLAVVDIAPRHYSTPSHVAAFRGLHELRLDSISSRTEAEMRLESRIPDPDMRRFLAGTLERDEAGHWQWPFNLFALTAALPHLKADPLGPADRFTGPACFLAGTDSPYIGPADASLIREHFPSAEIVHLHGSGHNPHLETRARFVEALETFLHPAPARQAVA
jgi:esterase